MDHREIEGGLWQLIGQVSGPRTRMGFGARVWLGLDEDMLIKGVLEFLMVFVIRFG